MVVLPVSCIELVWLMTQIGSVVKFRLPNMFWLATRSISEVISKLLMMTSSTWLSNNCYRYLGLLNFCRLFVFLSYSYVWEIPYMSASLKSILFMFLVSGCFQSFDVVSADLPGIPVPSSYLFSIFPPLSHAGQQNNEWNICKKTCCWQ